MVIAKARVDPWQHGTHPFHQTAHSVVDDEFHSVGPQVSLATAVAARFVNSLVTIQGNQAMYR